MQQTIGSWAFLPANYHHVHSCNPGLSSPRHLEVMYAINTQHSYYWFESTVDTKIPGLKYKLDWEEYKRVFTYRLLGAITTPDDVVIPTAEVSVIKLLCNYY